MSNGFPPYPGFDLPALPTEKKNSLKDTFAMVGGYVREIRRRVYIPLMVAGIIGGLMFYMAWKEPPKYTASLTFMIADVTPNYSTAIDPAILGNINMGNPNLEKIVDIMKSRKIMSATLLSKAKFRDAGEDLLINHYLATFTQSKYRFKEAKIDTNNVKETGIIKNVHGSIIKTMMTSVISPNGIVTLGMLTTSEDFSMQFLNKLFETASNYYIETTIEKQYKQYVLIRNRFDSLNAEVNGTELALAQDFDSHLAAVRFKEGVRQRGLQRDLDVTRRAFFEAAGHLEAARVALDNKRPLIQIIDEPLLPLTVTASNKRQSLIIGLIVGFILGAGIVSIRKYLREALNEGAETASETPPKT